MTQIGDRLAQLLKESGYTQKEFALMCGVTEAAMCRYLKNECAADLPAAGFIHAVEAFEYTRLML